MKTNEQISFVFFGSGPVAARSLELLKDHFDVEAVITKPSTKHEMQRIVPQTPVLCATSKAELDTIMHKRTFISQVGVLIDFGIIVSQSIIDTFPYGIVNSHFSLLPQWRGADPITFAVLSGQDITGVSLMLVVEKMDEGPLLAVSKHAIRVAETAPSLSEALVHDSAELLKQTLPRYLSNAIQPVDQIAMAEKNAYDNTVSYSRKLTKGDGEINWTKPAQEIEREIRAFAGWPKSYTAFDELDVTITAAHIVVENQIPNKAPGSLITIEGPKTLSVVCGNGVLGIDRIKPSGKKEMTIEAFLAGYRSKLHL